MKKNDVVKYVGKGFLGYDKNINQMYFIKKESFNSIYVLYKGQEMIVSPHEIESII